MASTYSDRLKLELMATGANANTWGTNTNNNLKTIDAFGAGYLAKSVAGSADITLSSNNADPTAEASKKIIEFTGALTGDIKVFIPAVENNYIFFNNTTGSHTLSIAPTGHSANAVAITQGAHTIMYNNASNKVVDLFAESLGTVSVKGLTNVAASTVQVKANGQLSATSFTGSGSGLSGVTTLDAGTQMVFLEASAPTGWTQNTAAALNNATLRVITSGTAGTGGSDNFQDVFAAKNTSGSAAADISPLSVSGGSIGSTTLSTPQLPSHSHSGNKGNSQNYKYQGGPAGATGLTLNTGSTSGSAGGSGSHTHPLSGSATVSGNISAPSVALAVPNMDIKHANVIVCSKD
tara:strand:+ start:4705 stop:5754 length:1050 start_codon:yes stop_codon:yes gene_type:complete